MSRPQNFDYVVFIKTFVPRFCRFGCGNPYLPGERFTRNQRNQLISLRATRSYSWTATYQIWAGDRTHIQIVGTSKICLDFRVIAPIQNKGHREATKVQNRGQISELFTTVKFRGSTDKMSGWIFRARPNFEPNFWYTCDRYRSACWETSGQFLYLRLEMCGNKFFVPNPSHFNDYSSHSHLIPILIWNLNPIPIFSHPVIPKSLPFPSGNSNQTSYYAQKVGCSKL